MSEFDKNWATAVDTKLENLEARISNLERLLSDWHKAKRTTPRESSKGPSGAIWKLIQENYLNEPKLVREIQGELNRQGHFYTLQVVDSTLRHMNKSKVLTRIGKKGEWRYVVRK